VLRLDRWLVVARFFRTRSLAAAAAAAGQVRVNGRHALRPGHAVAVGDTLTLVQGGRVRLIRIAGLAARRGPAAAAAALYVDLDAADDGAASGRLE
jgi:ribosome-associated heat shock protein Hsp15